jgi:hypothetical protein
MIIFKYRIFFFLYLVLSIGVAFAEEKKHSKILIEKVFFVKKHTEYSLSGDVSVSLEETLIDALGKGVTLEFISELELFSPRVIFPDQIKKKWKRKASLTYHGITRRFYVKIGEKKVFFESLTQALARCLGLKKWINLEKTYFKHNNNFRVRLGLNIDSLPKPLSLVAVSDPAWKISTGWILVNFEE